MSITHNMSNKKDIAIKIKITNYSIRSHVRLAFYYPSLTNKQRYFATTAGIGPLIYLPSLLIVKCGKCRI